MSKDSKAYKAATVLLWAVIIFAALTFAVTISNAQEVNFPFVLGALVAAAILIGLTWLLRWYAGKK